MHRIVPLFLLLTLIGCQTTSVDGMPTGSNDFESTVDGDGDGYSPDTGDCNDSNPYVNPGASEFCDGIDNDCDLLVDDEDATSIGLVWMFDGDSDGYGKASSDGDAQYIMACSTDTFEELVENTGGDPDILAFYVPAQYDASSEIHVDCNDSDASVNPGPPDVLDATEKIVV